MKNLFAAASYSFTNFYNDLNTRGQIVFSAIIFLIGILCLMLLIAYIVDGIKAKRSIKKIVKENIFKTVVKQKIENDEKKFNNEVEAIAQNVKAAIESEKPVNLNGFEEDEEKNAIISVDELMKKAQKLEIIDDDNGNVNYVEKYSEASKIPDEEHDEGKKEVKAFKVSQVISPIYGVKKEVINNQK